MMEIGAEHLGMVRHALQAYEITDYDARFIRHNENITYHIMDRAKRQAYLLRIHEPVSPNLRGIQQTFEGLCGEMEFTTALARGTDLKLQRPVANRHGSTITVVHDSTNGRSPLATLLTWVEGETLNEMAGDLSALTRKIGALAAQMHVFAKEWKEPRPFIRPVYDTYKYTHLVERLAYGVELGLFSEPTYHVIHQTMAKITGILAPLVHSHEHWGVIHADLKGDNLIVTEDGLVPIDFSFSGYGYYLFDIGGCAPSLKPELRASLLHGYEQHRPLTEADMRVIRCCFLLSIFGGFAFSITNPHRHEWIQRRVPAIADGYCAKFLRGEEFIFD